MTEKDKDFLEGLAISAACHVLPVRKVSREPIAYSYNGVILPKLPEWDREAYPYAFMYYHDGLFASAYHLYVGAEIFYDGDSIGVSGGGQSFFCLTSDLTKWTESTTDYNGKVCKITSVMWANFNVLGEDGSAYLSASEPIPIYE